MSAPLARQPSCPSRAHARETQLIMLPIDCVRPNPYQPRHSFSEDALCELTESIRQSGLIQPLIVRGTTRGYELIAGERRLRACKRLGMQEVPCVVQSFTAESDSALMALIENVQREDLHFLEEAECYRAIIRNCGLTQEQLASRLGKSQSFLANRLRLLRLSPVVRRALTQAGLSERHARALLQLTDERMQLDAIHRIVEKRMSVKDTERMIERTKTAAEASPRPKLLRLIKDYRLFLNAVKCSAEQLRDTGLSVELIQTDFDDGVDMLVRVRR